MLNKCQFIGNLGQDPEIRTMGNGKEVCNLSIGVSEKWKDKTTGEQKSKTEWVKVVIFSEGLVNVCKNYLNKGSKIFVEGKLQTRSWEQDGVKKYTTEIVLQGFGGTIIMLDGKSESKPDMSAHGQAPLVGDFADEIPFIRHMEGVLA